jgi:hypothetical protein
MSKGIRVGAIGILLVAILLPVDRPALAADPILIDWPALLPGLIDDYDPNSSNVCVAGRPECVAAAIREMKRRFEPLGRSCHHNAVFSLAYLRTTQTYQWASEQPDFFDDTPWVNHEDAVFARHYFEAYDGWAAGLRSQVPQAWLIAFDAAQNKRVSASGDLMLGMSAHINRDLPITLAAIGIATPDGDNRKADHDKVNVFLNKVMEPLLAEAAARFDEDILDIPTPFGVGYTGLFLQVQAWREKAYRNAELLGAAPTTRERELVLETIETDAALEAQTLATAYANVPPLLTSTRRDRFCATHNAASAPLPYAFGTPAAY